MSRKDMRRHIRTANGYFGVVVYRPKREVNVGTLWRSAFLNNAAFIGTIGHRYPERQASDTSCTDAQIPMLRYLDFDSMLLQLPRGCPIVAVELDDRAQMLNEFRHPPQALYLLGAEDAGIPKRILDRCHYVVQIPTVQNWSMNVATAGSIVMYDRLAKAIRERA